MRVAPSVHGYAYVPSQGHAARFPAVNLYRLHRLLNPDCLPQKFHCLQRMDKLRSRWMRRLAPCGLGGDRGAELVAAWRAPDFAPNRKDFNHQGRPEHLLWVRCSGPVPARVCSRCQDLLTDPFWRRTRNSISPGRNSHRQYALRT
jgi:hypothetical protein